MHAEAYYTIIPQIESEVWAVVVHTTHESAACTVLFHMRLLIGRYTPKCKDTSPKEVYPHSQCYQCTCRVCHCGQEQEGSKEGDRRWFHCYKQYAMPMRKMGKVTDKGGGVVGSGGVRWWRRENSMTTQWVPHMSQRQTASLASRVKEAPIKCWYALCSHGQEP